MEPTTPQEDRRRAYFMNWLYERSGRTNGLYTGLWDMWCREAGRTLMELKFGEHLVIERTDHQNGPAD